MSRIQASSVSSSTTDTPSGRQGPGPVGLGGGDGHGHGLGGGDGGGHRGEGRLRRRPRRRARCRAGAGHAIQQPAWGAHSAGMANPSAAGVESRVRLMGPTLVRHPASPDRGRCLSARGPGGRPPLGPAAEVQNRAEDGVRRAPTGRAGERSAVGSDRVGSGARFYATRLVTVHWRVPLRRLVPNGQVDELRRTVEDLTTIHVRRGAGGDGRLGPVPKPIMIEAPFDDPDAVRAPIIDGGAHAPGTETTRSGSPSSGRRGWRVTVPPKGGRVR